MRRLISWVLCLALFVSGTAYAQTMTATEILWDENEETILLENGGEYGVGEKTFRLLVSCMNECASVLVHTDAETVGEALLEQSIIAGEEGQFGLYVKTVNGITADYDTDGTYWAFYIDDAYAMTGVDATQIDEQSIYLLKVEGKELEDGDTILLRDGKNYGFGQKQLALRVVLDEENTVSVMVSTDAETVGEALLSLGIIAGEEGQYGLYVKTVDGVTADYDTDGTYWAFYIDDAYAMTGVDATEIDENAVYTLKVEG